MNNYISINNQKIELTEDQVRQIREAYSSKSSLLCNVSVGELVKIGDYEFIVLEQFGEETALILKDFYGEDSEFDGKNNNYNGSYVDKKCQEFAQKLAERVGWGNIVLHTVDLTSDDGLKDYGTVERHASLLTAEMYRKYVDILDKFNREKWWWLATPYSTKRHGDTTWIKCVSPSGGICHGNCGVRDDGVRPFCILKSYIFVSR